MEIYKFGIKYDERVVYLIDRVSRHHPERVLHGVRVVLLQPKGLVGLPKTVDLYEEEARQLIRQVDTALHEEAAQRFSRYVNHQQVTERLEGEYNEVASTLIQLIRAFPKERA